MVFTGLVSILLTPRFPLIMAHSLRSYAGTISVWPNGFVVNLEATN